MPDAVKIALRSLLDTTFSTRRELREAIERLSGP
jgi:hypothetical protein